MRNDWWRYQFDPAADSSSARCHACNGGVSYTNGKPTGRAKAFVEFALSAAGQMIVAGAGLVPLH